MKTSLFGLGGGSAPQVLGGTAEVTRHVLRVAAHWNVNWGTVVAVDVVGWVVAVVVVVELVLDVVVPNDVAVTPTGSAVASPRVVGADEVDVPLALTFVELVSLPTNTIVRMISVDTGADGREGDAPVPHNGDDPRATTFEKSSFHCPGGRSSAPIPTATESTRRSTPVWQHLPDDAGRGAGTTFDAALCVQRSSVFVVSVVSARLAGNLLLHHLGVSTEVFIVGLLRRPVRRHVVHVPHDQPPVRDRRAHPRLRPFMEAERHLAWVVGVLPGASRAGDRDAAVGRTPRPPRRFTEGARSTPRWRHSLITSRSIIAWSAPDSEELVFRGSCNDHCAARSRLGDPGAGRAVRPVSRNARTRRDERSLRRRFECRRLGARVGGVEVAAARPEQHRALLRQRNERCVPVRLALNHREMRRRCVTSLDKLRLATKRRREPR